MHITQKSAQNIVNEMKASIHRDINIMDENGVILASTDPTRRGKLHQGALAIIREGLDCLTVRQDEPERGIQRGVNLPVTLRGQLEGVIGITGEPEEVAVFGEIIRHMTEIMLEAAYQQEELELLQRSRSLFVENWLFDAQPDWTELQVRGRLLGIDISQPYTVAVLNTGGDEEDTLSLDRVMKRVQTGLAENGGGFCAVLRGRVILLLSRTERSEAARRVRELCRMAETVCGGHVSAGISSRSEAPETLRRCYREAVAAAAAAEQPKRGRVVFYDEASLEFLADCIPSAVRRAARARIFARCTPQEAEELAQTVALYFAEDGDVRRCAEKLFVHRNTFQYRMDTVKRKTGLDLRRPRDAALLYLVLRAVTRGAA